MANEDSYESGSSGLVPQQQLKPPARASSASSSSLWSLQIRTVNAKEQSDFSVQVHPEDEIETLYNKIETQTGLSPEQQRLIYRGRLVSATAAPAQDSRKIQDITGLSDGHCIHLVKRREETNATTAETSPSLRSESSSGSASLLSTILGLSSSSNNSNATSPTAATSTNDTGSNTSTTGGAGGDNNNNSNASTRRWRRFGRRGRAHYRLTADDLEVPDPGSMESVRQGLMTMHTLLPATNHVSNPLETNRRWYRGQWIDCRDTVNQWLEATVVEIVAPEDILPPRPPAPARPLHSTTQPVTDPPVHGDDMNGRYRLLLEPCPEGCPDEDEGGEWQGFRRRASNANVVLLLIHYNGWPHRWDEWIRSDSERLRPFRVRTRHPNANQHVSPTVQAQFADQPSTAIRGSTESEDRQHLLPEVLRVMHQVQNLMEQAVGPEAAANATATTEALSPTAPLPWRRRRPQDPPEEDDADSVESSTRTDTRAQQRALQALAPMLDRLGRTLVDAAPHVAALAAARAEEAPSSLDTIDEHPSSLGGLLSMLSRDRRRNSMASSQAVASNATATAADQATVTTADVNSEVSIDPDYTDFAAGLVNTTRGEVRTGPRSRSSTGADDLGSLLGAYLAAASLASSDSGDDSNLQLLGRILRDRDSSGGGGGGIDIHIHAVVTAPGMLGDGDTGGTATTTGGGGGGGLGALLAGLGGGVATATTTDANTVANNTATAALTEDLESYLPTARRVPTILQQQDDDLGIFSELYSENPEPAANATAAAATGAAAAASTHQTPTAVVTPSTSPLRATATPSSQRRSPRHTSSPSASSHNNTSATVNHNNSTPQTSSPTQRRQGFLGRFLRRNQQSQ